MIDNNKKKVILKLKKLTKSPVQESKIEQVKINTKNEASGYSQKSIPNKFVTNKLNLGQFKAYKITSKIQPSKTSGKVKQKVLATKSKYEICVFNGIKLSALIQRMAENKDKVLKILKKHNFNFKLDDSLDLDSAILIIELFQHIPKIINEYDTVVTRELDIEQNLQTRSPIITVVGHVDHGKTSLLDAIRNTNYTNKETGGITQSIGAYQVEINKKQITFIDTPGHEAFIEMRSRGICLTDIVLLVVAADDSVKDQTIESIKHIRNANVPMIIVINKIDTAGANIKRVLNDLLAQDIVSNQFNGGNAITVEVSAKQKTNINQLLEIILSQAESMNITADLSRLECVVIESELQKGVGPVATVIIKHGQLQIGDIFGKTAGKVRILKNWENKSIKCGIPGQPVLVIGLEDLPSPGDILEKVDNIDIARNIAKARYDQIKDNIVNKSENDFIANLLASMQETFPIVLKAHNQGALEAIKFSLEQITKANINVCVVSSGIGDVAISDIEFAKVVGAEIIGFNINISNQLAQKIKSYDLEFSQYNIIYRVIDYILEKLDKRISLNTVIKYTGQAEVIKIFKVPNVGTVIGCKILEGIACINDQVTVFRRSTEIYTGKVSSMQRELLGVKSSELGQECAIIITGIKGDRHFSNIELKDKLSFLSSEN